MGGTEDPGERPAVLDPDETWLLPHEVYLACRPDPHSGDVMLELREWDRQQVVLAYSSLDSFLASCGSDQPWILVPSVRLAEIAVDKEGNALEPASFRFSVLIDVAVPGQLRGTAGGMADEEASWDEPDSTDWTMVHLASQPFDRGDAEAKLELQPMPGHHLAVMAYSSPEAVEAGCGPYQESVQVPAGLVGEARRQSGADTICLDTPLPQHLRHGTGERN